MKRKLLHSMLAIAVLPCVCLLGGCDDPNTPIQDGSAQNPYLVSNVSDFMAMDDKQDGSHFKLTSNINLNDIENAYADSYYLMENFNGVIDGNGKTITLNNNAHNGYSIVFDEFGGTLKNVTLDFNNINNESGWAGNSSEANATSFQNVTTTGTINVPFNTVNYSPLINYAQNDLSFINCTNDLDILGVAERGSAFLGSYPKTTETNLTFRNCTNTGKIVMNKASMLQGNHTRFSSNTTIENCTNEGEIVGLTSAGLYNGMIITNNADKEAIRQNLNGQVTNTQNGTCTTQGISGVTLTTNANNKVVINNSNAGNYTYLITANVYYSAYKNSERTGSSVVGISLTTNETGETNLYNYQFIDKAKFETMTGATKTAVTNLQVKVNQAGNQAYLWDVEFEGTHYYYIEIADSIGYSLTMGGAIRTPNTTLLVIDQQQNPVALQALA